MSEKTFSQMWKNIEIRFTAVVHILGNKLTVVKVADLTAALSR